MNYVQVSLTGSEIRTTTRAQSLIPQLYAISAAPHQPWEERILEVFKALCSVVYSWDFKSVRMGGDWCHSWPDKSDKIYALFFSVSYFQRNYFYREFLILTSVAWKSECGRHPGLSLPPYSRDVNTSWFPL